MGRHWMIAMVVGLTWCGVAHACTGLPLIGAAWKELPEEQRFPCDSEHLVLIRDFGAFLKVHPDLAANEKLRERARHALGFSISSTWPIYINLDSHEGLVEAYGSRPWVACMMAGVLAHERVHAMGNGSEQAALLAELELDRRFRAEGKLPAEFDLKGLERQVLEAAPKNGGF